MEGLRLTNFPTGLAKSIIIATDRITAIIIKGKAPCKPLVIPTAVKILSIEKIMSIISI